MVDSGDQIFDGYYTGIYSVYQSMVDYALTRPPRADIQANWERIGSQVRFTVQLKNLSGKTLSTSNGATLHAIVYEENRILYTNRFVRSAISTSIINLANNTAGSFTLTTPSLSGVDWSRLHYLVLADYHPSAGSESYDMLQAVVATSVTVVPEEMFFMVDPLDSQVISQAAQINASAGFAWSASPDAAWINVMPTSGSLPTQPVISVDKGLLGAGWQTGKVSFSTMTGTLMDTMTIKAYLGALKRVYLPFINR